MNFSSVFNATDRASVVKAMFVKVTNSDLHPYFGIVKYFFTVTVLVNQTPITHKLAYVNWLKFRNSMPDPLCKLYGVSKDTYQTDKIIVQDDFCADVYSVQQNHLYHSP